MSLPILSSTDDICAALRQSIESAIPDATAEVAPGSPGHYELRVTAQGFEGKSMVQQQQLVYSAIKPLMQGDDAPVHAIDRLRTSVS